MHEREFICTECGLEICSWGDIDEVDVCQVCRWLQDNTKLTKAERDMLRIRLRGGVNHAR